MFSFSRVRRALAALLPGLLLLGMPRPMPAQDAGRYVALVAEGDRKAAAKDHAGAWALFVQARDLDPQGKGAHLRLALTALELRRRAEGLAALDAIRDLDPASVHDKDLTLLRRDLAALPVDGAPVAPRGGLLEAATAEAALREATTAWEAGDRVRARQFAREAWDVLLPVLREAAKAGVEVWRATVRAALFLEDKELAAGALAAVEKLQPDYAADAALLRWMGEIHRLADKARLEEARKDFAAFATALLDRPGTGRTFANSLGMKFVSVPGTTVLFSVWETRVRDFEVFVRESGHRADEGMFSLGTNGWKQTGATWRNPGFAQTPDDPVVGVSWEDAQAFCRWLSAREGRRYRLPTDREWSAAIGSGAETGATPKERDAKIADVYPWGSGWPPPSNSGNYAGAESRIGQEPADWHVIEGFEDRFPRTAPVGQFPPSRDGLFDLAGNVWEWCDDPYDVEPAWRVLRGGSWINNETKSLLSSSRLRRAAGFRYDFYGLRCVLVLEAPR